MNKCKVLFAIALILLAGVFIFFIRLYNQDVKALSDFLAAYQKFDQAISDYSAAVFAPNKGNVSTADVLQQKADEALADLNAKASVRISSLIKNDAGLMRTALQIGELSGKEFDSLKACRSAAADKNAALDRLAKEHGDLTNQRQAAYNQFQKLAGQ